MDCVWEIKVKYNEDPLCILGYEVCLCALQSHPSGIMEWSPQWRQSQKTCKSQGTDKFVITFWKWLSQIFKITCYSCFLMRGEWWYFNKWKKPLWKNWKTWESSQQALSKLLWMTTKKPTWIFKKLLTRSLIKGTGTVEFTMA